MAIFLDTSGLFAVLVPGTPKHVEASDWLRCQPDELFISDYVLDEICTLLLVRGERNRIPVLAKAVFEDNWARVVFVGRNDFMEAWSLLEAYSDKHWSFTDCTTYLLMKRLRINKALSLDNHFRQFGFAEVFP